MSNRLLAAGVLAAIGVGGLLHLVSQPELGDAVWAAATAVVLVPLAWSVARTLLRGDVGVDAIALRGDGGGARARRVPGRRRRRR